MPYVFCLFAYNLYSLIITHYTLIITLSPIQSGTSYYLLLWNNKNPYFYILKRKKYD